MQSEKPRLGQKSGPQDRVGENAVQAAECVRENPVLGYDARPLHAFNQGGGPARLGPNDSPTGSTCAVSSCTFDPINPDYVMEYPTDDTRKMSELSIDGGIWLPVPQTAEDGIPAPPLSPNSPPLPGIELKRFELYYESGKIEQRFERYRYGNCRCTNPDGSVDVDFGGRQYFKDVWRPTGETYRDHNLF